MPEEFSNKPPKPGEGAPYRAALVDDQDFKREREVKQLEEQLGADWEVSGFKLGTVTWSQIAAFDPDGVVLDLADQSEPLDMRYSASGQLLDDFLRWGKSIDGNVIVIVQSVEKVPNRVRPRVVVPAKPWAYQSWATLLWDFVTGRDSP